MRKKRKKKSKTPENSGLFKGVFAAYSILILHVILLAALGCLVLFFRGFVNYMLWIFLGGSALITYSGVRIYKRMKHENKNLRDMLQLPMFEGKSVEVDLFGGMASVKIKQDGPSGALPPKEIPVITDERNHPYQIEESPVSHVEDPAVSRVRELTELARLYENNLLTLEEFEQSKKQIMQEMKKT